MSNVSLKNNENEIDITFFVEEKKCTLTLNEIDADGSCLFGALVHQFSKPKLNNRVHKNGNKKLRADIVAHLKKNRSDFQHELEGRIYEQFNEISNDNMKSAIDNFLIQLSKQSTWGGYESIIAFTQIKKSNVLLINQNGHGYYPAGFDHLLKRTVILAFTKVLCEEHEVTEIKTECEDGSVVQNVANISNTQRNHYNSIVRMDQSDIFDLSRLLAVQALKRSQMPDIIYVQ